MNRWLTRAALLRLGQRNLVAFFQGDDRFFPRAGPTGSRLALTAGFATDVQRVDGGNLDFEQFLHGLADLRLVGARIGDDGVLVQKRGLARAFFGHANGFDNIERFHITWPIVFRRLRSRRG
jgi:hypothetical protein